MIDVEPPRNVLVLLVDEVGRLNGRLKSGFAEARRSAGLGETELTVLNAVVEADRAPTVPQIGRSLGLARQIVQRAANALIADGVIETMPNPDHKRAGLLRATPLGVAKKAEIDRTGDAIAARLADGIDMDAAYAAVASLRAVRKSLESHLRGGRN
jgi:DNA-binding MarR family transcriptional regulator